MSASFGACTLGSRRYSGTRCRRRPRRKTDPHAADARCEAATRRLIARTRDRKRFGLLFVENVNYGMRRRAARGELGEAEIEIPGVHYGVRQGDRVALIDQHHERGRQRFENGERGQVLDVNQAGEVSIEFDSTGRKATLAGEDLTNLRLAYASHMHRAQGATATRTVVVSGGWQTSKEPAYVEASRARHGTDWYLSRQDLGEDGQDSDRIGRLAQAMKTSRAQTPSLAHAEHPRHVSQLPGRDLHIDTAVGHDRPRLRNDPGRADRRLEIHILPSRGSVDPHWQLATPPSRRPLPGLARTIRRLATPNRDLSCGR